ncbi:phytanoyl-CoA dioxygenase family protein [Nonomuraea rubra]|uniref:Phytanoyl-CoA dioxygenase family protein n=1 Tax=Nonomuraea rubra TaxID=46180 RepID=A0A7X0U1K7_9ACTN|nr:phytanoyl-CoA dioxygenase family protein [Nonomuraea rubra]MBB6551534.1 hypothetical protein [Nonomuraea rubra]
MTGDERATTATGERRTSVTATGGGRTDGAPAEGTAAGGESARGVPTTGGPAGGASAGGASAGGASAGRTSAGGASAGRTSAGGASAGRTSAGRTSAGRTSAGRTSAGRASAGGASAGGALSALHRDGYLVLPDLLDPGECRRIRTELTPVLGPAGRDPFRSRHIRRVYGVLHNTRATDPLIDHPRVLALLDRLLLPNYLLSQLEVVEVGAGAPARPPGYDDRPYPLPRPRPALSIAALWALDAGTALTVWPGSHRWPAGDPTAPGVPLTPPPGSCAIVLGTLWHARPPQPSTSLTITAHYCEPWLRTREAFALSPGRHVARQLSNRARRMLGYSIHPPDLGLVDGVHPYRLFS